MSDKKGGGLMLLTWKDGEVKLNKLECGGRDVLVVEVEVGDVRCVVMLVYMDVGDLSRNKVIYDELDRAMRKIPENVPKVVMGDFNGHVGFLGTQDLNRKGEMMLEFAERWNMVILNADDKCEGEYTRVQGNERSVIDYYLVDEKMYDRFESMVIDDDKDRYDLSDHCYMSARFRVSGVGEDMNGEGWEWNEYYKVKDRALLDDFVRGVEEKLDEMSEVDVIEFENVVKEKAEECLNRKVRRRVGGRKKRVEPPWMNDKIRREIKWRRELNRRRRRTEGEERDRYWKQYKDQKEKVKKYVREEK